MSLVHLAFMSLQECPFVPLKFTSSMGGILSLLCFFIHIFMYRNGFLNRGFADQREILHGGSATFRTGLFPF